MKKLSLAMLTVALGLMFVGSTNAMTYNVTVDGDESQTQVSIPSDTSEGITIDWGDGSPLITLASDCGTRVYLSEVHEYVYKCTKTYDAAGEYTININNTRGTRVTLLYLNSSNVSSISNFNGFSQLSTIYLRNNGIIEIGNNALSSLRSDYATIHLEGNQIDSFLPEMTNVRNLYLNENGLTRIPSTIWDARDNTEIKLSNTISYGDSSKSKLADLRDNDIEFIKITEINGYDSSLYQYNGYGFQNATSYQFAWFGYSYDNESDLRFDYSILDDYDNLVTADETTQSYVEITNPLEPGQYKFKVCLHNDAVNCDTIRFDVDYTSGIEFITRNPSYGSTIGYMDGISFTWQKTGDYPESFISGYNYTLTKDGIEIDSGSSSNNPTSYTLDTSLIDDNPNGDYTFTIYLIDKNGNTINVPALTTFTIQIDNSIYINSPTGIQHGNGEDTKNVRFDWQTSTSLFGYYDYYVTSSSSCSESATIITGGRSAEPNTIFNHPLENGNYLLCIDMYDSTSNHNRLNEITVSNSFSVNIPATVSITAPSSTVSVQPIQFTRDSFLPTPYTFINYTYSVKKGTEVVSSDTITGQNNRSFSLNNLHDGTYTVNVIMNHSSGSTGDTKIFTVNSSAGVYLNLTPVDGASLAGNHVSQVPVTLSWEGGGSPLISKYTYKLTNTSTSEIIDSGTKDATDTLSLGTKLLPSGTYKFEVVMLDSDDIEITNSYSDFTVLVPSDLEILSPLDGLSPTKDVIFSRSGFDEFGEHYNYILKKIDDAGNETLITGNDYTTSTSFTMPNLLNGTYTFNVTLIDIYDQPIITKSVTFLVPDSQDLTISISDGQHSVTTLNSRTGIFSRGGESENFDSYSYSIVGTTFKDESYSYNGTSKSPSGNFTLNDLSTGRYRFTVNMLDSNSNTITGKYLDFNVVIPATLKITSPADGATITTSSTTFTWTGYNDIITKYEYKLTGQPTNSTGSTSFTANLANGNYTLSVKLYSGDTPVAQDSIDFKINAATKPTGGGGGGSSSKTHYNNNLKLSLGNDSPSANEWIKLVVKIDDKYTGKVSFPKLQYYSPDTEKWIDIPVTSKNYVSDYSDDAKLGYIKFSSSDDGRKDLEQFIKFSKNGYYRIYAEDKDGYDDYIEFQVSNKKVSTNTATNTQNNTTVSNTPNNIDSVINQFMPEVLEQKDTSEEVYIARSCKKYTIVYSDSLNIYTSPNLNISEFFMNKAYLKRYLDSKNRYQSGCPTNIGWISTSYIDRTEDNTRYTAPNGKVYFIIGQEGNYYSNELNRELKTPTSFKTIQELKYYIRDRNPLINMATLGPVN